MGCESADYYGGEERGRPSPMAQDRASDHDRSYEAGLQDLPFGELVNRLHKDDNQAWEELLRRFGQQLRVVIRVRLGDLYRSPWSSHEDVYQSALRVFFERFAAGKFCIERPQDFMALMSKIIRDTSVNRLVRKHAQKRDCRRNVGGEMIDAAIADRARDASMTLENRELVERAMALLTWTSGQVAKRRAEGESWEKIGQAFNRDPDCLRMRLKYKAQKIRQELGMTDDSAE